MMQAISIRRLLPLLLLLGLVHGCSTFGPARTVDGKVPLNKAVTELSEAQLLDVWVELFNPGELPEDKDEAMGLSMDIREAEARYLPEQLRTTMENTGYWGAVRLVPQNTTGSEVRVRGTILESDGEQLVLDIQALDATGREWFKRTYREEVEYAQHLASGADNEEAFQSLYNTIANDLAAFRAKLDAAQTTTIRRTAALRFAVDLAPDAFAGYLEEDADQFMVVHLPSADDPMYHRVLAIRDRDFLLIDTLNGHFDNFTREMQTPYTQWRKARSEEAAALRELKRDALKRKLLGAAAILGAIAIEATTDSGNSGSTVLRDAMVLGGAYAIKTGFDKSSETAIHRDAIVELDESFSSEARPMVVEVEGEVHELTGSAEVQYAKWRALLKRIYASETGLAGS
ncbi:MAG: hypothetical protein WBO34_03520 [Gammaproteobacteria bacterium]